ncbi:MAG TPA: biotin/lipoyl-containing protein [candidate division Zixibacteria bacterium]|nr:biotin/lipoyl-containing protein [candidate division Zixibacteria bacterium]
MKYITTVNGDKYEIDIDQEDRITVDSKTYKTDVQFLSDSGVLSLLLNNHSVEAIVEQREDSWEVLIHGELYTVLVQDERAFRLAKERGSSFEVSGDAIIKSPMPGLIIDILVDVGQSVEKGEKIVVLESMKMENELRSPRDGVVSHIYVSPGAGVEKGQALVTIVNPPPN